MQLQNNEEILYRTKPVHAIYLLIFCIFLAIYVIFALPPQSKHLIVLGILFLLSIFRYFDYILITNQRIVSQTLLRQRTVQRSELQQPPCLMIDPKKFKQYEWRRKLLKQNFQNFWFHKTDIYFKQSISSTNPKSLERMALPLFSKKQKNQIIQTLIHSWQLDPIIERQE